MKETARRNIRTLYQEAVLFGLFNGIPAAFISVYALRLGAPNQAIGLITALPALINALWLIPSARLIERRRHILATLMLCGFLAGAQYLVLVLLPALPTAAQTPVLLLIIALGAMPAGLYSVLINTVLADTIPPPERVRALGNRNLFLSLSDATVVFGGGWFLGLFVFPSNYRLAFLIVFGLSLMNLVVLRNLVLPRLPAGTASAAPVNLTLNRVRELLRDEGEARDFLRFLLAASAIQFGGWVVRPLFSIYWVRTLSASDAWVGILAGAFSFTAMLAYPVWGRFAPDMSSRRLLLLGSLGAAAYPFLTVLAPAPAFLLIPAVIGGVMAPPLNIGLMNGLLDVAPELHRPTFIAVYTATANLSGFVGPILCTSLLLPVIGIKAAIWIGAGVRLLGWAAVFALVKKPGVNPCSRSKGML